MNGRIKAIRKHYNLTQDEFGKRIGVKQGSIAGYENGLRTPLDAVITSICREYKVNRNWLVTGTGEMFASSTRVEEIGDFINSFMSEEDDFKRRFISVLARLDVDEWKLIEKMALKLVEESKKD